MDFSLIVAAAIVGTAVCTALLCTVVFASILGNALRRHN